MSTFFKLSEISAAKAEANGLTKIKAEFTAINEHTGVHTPVSIKGWADDSEGVAYIDILDAASEELSEALIARNSPARHSLLCDGTWDPC